MRQSNLLPLVDALTYSFRKVLFGSFGHDITSPTFGAKIHADSSHLVNGRDLLMLHGRLNADNDFEAVMQAKREDLERRYQAAYDLNWPKSPRSGGRVNG